MQAAFARPMTGSVIVVWSMLSTYFASQHDSSKQLGSLLSLFLEESHADIRQSGINGQCEEGQSLRRRRCTARPCRRRSRPVALALFLTLAMTAEPWSCVLMENEAVAWDMGMGYLLKAYACRKQERGDLDWLVLCW